MSNYDNMPPEQQQYTQISAANKTLYQARKLSMELQHAALTPNFDPLAIAQKANELACMVEKSANRLYAVKMGIEERNPEFKAQAVEYAKAREHQKTVQPEQSF